MHKIRLLVGIGLCTLLLGGIGYALVTERPAAKRQTSATSTLSSDNPSTSFTREQVAKHSTSTNCWTSIEGNVYDLTTWITRHPGGPGPIKRLCGTDATEKFLAKHGTSDKPRAALVLLKIGTLK